MVNQMTINRAVVVTGASRGIGEACALYLDKLGFHIFAGVRKKEDGETLKQKASSRLTPVIIDVTDAASIKSAVETVANSVKETGLAGLVNNAGIAVAGPLGFLPIKELRKQFEVNVIGQISVTQAFLPLLQKGNGRIINIGSKEGRMAMPFLGPYCASKFAMEALTSSLRMELRPWGIPVSIIEPGTIATPILGKSIAAAEDVMSKLPQQARDLYSTAISAGRELAYKFIKAAIPPDTVARAVAHALTAKRPKTRYIVGQDAKLIAIITRFIPDGIRDWFMARQMGLLRGTQCPS